MSLNKRIDDAERAMKAARTRVQHVGPGAIVEHVVGSDEYVVDGQTFTRDELDDYLLRLGDVGLTVVVEMPSGT